MYDVATVLKDAKKKNVYVQLKYSGFNQQVLNPLPRKWVPLTTGCFAVFKNISNV